MFAMHLIYWQLWLLICRVSEIQLW